MHRRVSIESWLLPVLFLLGCTTTSAALADTPRDGLEFFEKKIRPLLVEKCHKCHGPKKQKAGLRLDSRAAILKGGESGPAIVPGEPGKSLMIKATGYQDPELRMPPRGKLADDLVADLTAWIRMGAPWPDDAMVKKSPSKEFNLKERAGHWSLLPLQNPPLPAVKNKNWPRSPIDHFILAGLENKGLTPAPPADKRTLLRRVTFDLIGLPPAPAEIDAFLADNSADAFAKVVDRLLASPHYGERWGRHWLDLVRFAETAGHEFDFEYPDAYRYRDYVIGAFNADVPYDQIVREHLAGDLLARPRRHPTEGYNESILATGFFFLGEAKHSPVDVRGDQADRLDNQIDVFSKTFLALTVACARCHDHKFDAISTKDYYALAGYLQSGRFQQAFIDPPQPTRTKISDLRKLQARSRDLAIPEATRLLAGQVPQLAKTLLTKINGRGLPGTAGNGNDIVFADFGRDSFKHWFVTGTAFGDGPSRGNDLVLYEGRANPVKSIVPPGLAHSGLISNRLQGALRSRTFRISKKKIHYQVAGNHGQINLIIDGFQQIREPIYGGLTFGINHGDLLRWHTQDVGMWLGHRAYIEVLDNGPGFVALDKIVFADEGPPAEPANRLLQEVLKNGSSAQAIDGKLRKLLHEILEQWRKEKLAGQPDARERIDVLNWMLEANRAISRQAAPEGQKLADLVSQYRAIEAGLPSPRRALAMAEGSPVDENVFIRGNHKKLGDIVPRRFLEVFGGTEDVPPATSSGRLELADRMVDPAKTPILPRVLVNRLWQHHFGEGIVRSVDNFGVLGQSPSHTELLDFLAGQFVKNGWSIKKLHRLMLLSSSYQMSSRPDSRADLVDPENKLLHKMPVRRLEAEIIRDALLAVSGRLDRTMYGPGVLPHLTPFMVGRGRPGTSGPLDGAGRRSIYINVRRNFLTPMFLAFDYPTPFSTMGKRSVSNVPAQALTMMNNPLVLQQAELWAKRTLAEPGVSARERIHKMYVAAFGRPPSEAELADTLGFLQEQGRVYARPNDPKAWADLCHVLFNTKEFIFVN